jgi:RND family efflux transporter MFP subunit
MRIVAAPVSGMVEMLAVAPGSSVKKGQIVAHLASPQALELQRDTLQSASQATLLQQSLKRDELLFSEGLIAESRLQATRAAANQAGAQASERRQGIALAGIAPGKLGGPLALTAAIDGVVLEQGVQLGQRVEAATLIYRIAKLAPLWLEIQAPVDFAATLKEGMAVKIAHSEVSGKLISLGRNVDAASQTVLLRAEVSKGAEALRPGQVIEVEIAGAGSKGLALPASALIRHDGKTLVFVQTASSEQGIRFEGREVRVISQGGERVVVDGVKEGERVASKGVSSLKAMLTGVGKE